MRKISTVLSLVLVVMVVACQGATPAPAAPKALPGCEVSITQTAAPSPSWEKVTASGSPARVAADVFIYEGMDWRYTISYNSLAKDYMLLSQGPVVRFVGAELGTVLKVSRTCASKDYFQKYDGRDWYFWNPPTPKNR